MTRDQYHDRNNRRITKEQAVLEKITASSTRLRSSKRKISTAENRVVVRRRIGPLAYQG